MLDQAIGQRRKQHIKLCGFNSKRETTTTILQGPSIWGKRKNVLGKWILSRCQPHFSKYNETERFTLKLYTNLVCNVLTFAPRDPFCIFSNPKAKTQSDEPVMVWMAQLGFT